MKLKRSLLLSLMFAPLILSLSTDQAIGKKNSLKNLQDTYSRHVSDLASLRAKIQTLDQKIGESSQSFEQKVQEKKELESQIDNFAKRRKKSMASLQEHAMRLKKYMAMYILLGSHENQSFTQLKKMQIAKKSVAKEREKLGELFSVDQNLMESFQKLETRYKDIQIVESTLNELILTMERGRAKLSAQVKTKREGQDSLREQIALLKKREQKNLLAKKRAKLKLLASKNAQKVALLRPFNQILKIEKKDKGLNLFFKGAKKIRSPKKGRILYQGGLSTLGHVVMIDHGQGLRSIFLGPMNPGVKRGESVERGQAIGETLAKKDHLPLYFELRKNEKYFQSIAWQDQDIDPEKQIGVKI